MSFPYIKAKSDGLDLFIHENSVLDTANLINHVNDFGFNDEIVFWSCILHDVGKANPLFQSNMERQNFENVCRHEISSVLFIKAVPEPIRDIVALIILSHHKSLDAETNRSITKLWNEDKNFYKNHIGDIEIWGKLVKDFLYLHYHISIEIPSKKECYDILDYYYDFINNLKSKKTSEYRGLFQMADHFASAYSNDSERLKEFSKLFVEPNVDFYNTKNEKYPLSLIESDKTKKHTIVVAPTGCGKTNFMMKRCTKRIFYTLPFQASINAMYQRLNNDINPKIGETNDRQYQFGLLHGSMATLDFLSTNGKILSRFFGLPLKVMTPFQMMPIIFKLKGFESLILDIKGQDVILDEIHTYFFQNNDKSLTTQCVVRLVETLKELGCNIHICTATIPSKLMADIIQILGEENTQIVRLDNKILDTFNRHTIYCKDNSFIENEEEIIERYNNGEKVLVVRNQVDLAIATYMSLKSRCDNAKILLLHSRFKREDRANLEKKLMDDFNKSTEPCIVVSTQVVEVSIDINFDCMFTDCADIMSLIQRFGRVNRQRTNIGVLKPIFVIKSITDKTNNTSLPYKDTDCDATFNTLSKYNGNVLEERNIQSIIDEVHPTYTYNKQSYVGLDITEFCNKPNSSIAKELEIVGYVGILEQDLPMYLATFDSKYEIPLGKKHNGLVPFDKKGNINSDDEHTIGFIISNNFYNSDCGYMRI